MSKERKKPNFFIVGAAKSGTTSIANYLGQHPEIFISALKEPFFFVKDAGVNDFDEYLSLFKKAGNALAIGEASTGYLYEDAAPKKIHDMFPYSKILIILRNPVDMVFSYWQYMFLIGNETKSIEEAISDEERKYRKTDEFKKKALRWWNSYLYLERAMYFNQVKRYLNVFGSENVRVYIFEEFFKDLPNGCREIFAFLGVNKDFAPQFNVLNEGGNIRFRFLHAIRNRRYPLLKKVVPAEIRYKLSALFLNLNIKKGKKAEMNPETRKMLETFFAKDIILLEQLIGRQIPAWKPVNTTTC